MTAQYCPKCGTQLKKTTLGRFWCMNCGIIEKDEVKLEEKGNEKQTYIS